MILQIIPEEDCSIRGGTRKSDIQKTETKKREKLRAKKTTKKIIKDKYVYTTIWDSYQNRQRRMRIYLKDKYLTKADI